MAGEDLESIRAALIEATVSRAILIRVVSTTARDGQVIITLASEDDRERARQVVDGLQRAGRAEQGPQGYLAVDQERADPGRWFVIRTVRPVTWANTRRCLVVNNPAEGHLESDYYQVREHGRSATALFTYRVISVRGEALRELERSNFVMYGPAGELAFREIRGRRLVHFQQAVALEDNADGERRQEASRETDRVFDETLQEMDQDDPESTESEALP